MLQWALIFFVIAVIAAVLGARGVAGMSAQIGYFLVAIAVVFLVIALRRQPPEIPADHRDVQRDVRALPDRGRGGAAHRQDAGLHREGEELVAAGHPRHRERRLCGRLDRVELLAKLPCDGCLTTA